MKKKTVVSLFLFLLALPAFAGADAGVEFFSPQGAVKDIRQVSVRFSEPMAPFGDPRIIEPFTISCLEKGSGRWADSRNWIYDFDRNLPAGTICTFSLKPEIKTLSGQVLTGDKQFSFTTGGPAIRSSRPYEGSDQVSEDQAFLLTLDALPDETSVIENVYFAVQGIQEQIGIRIIKGEEQKVIFKAMHIKDDAIPRIMIAARQKFPNNAQISLVWGQGVKTLTGVSSEKNQILPFKTRSPFTASFTCRRENPRAGCIPMLPMHIEFSAPVSLSYAAKTTLKGSRGKIYKPTLFDDGGEQIKETEKVAGPPKFVWRVRFAGPFPENAAFTVSVPKDMKDDAERSLANADRFPLSVKTDAYPPLAKFSARFGIIELMAGAVLPVTLRNLEPSVTTRQLKAGEKDEDVIEKLKESAVDEAVKIGDAVNKILPEPARSIGDQMVKGLKGRLHQVKIDREEQIIQWLRIVHEARRKESIFKSLPSSKPFSVPKPQGARAFEVVGIPLKAPGFYVVEMESRILGASLMEKAQPMYVPTTALVTNLSAHFKWGRESSIVWVTTLNSGTPVKDAAVSIRDCTGTVLWTGKTDVNGIARIKGPLPAPKPYCEASSKHERYNDSDPGDEYPRRWMNSGAFVFAKKDADLTFVHSSWDDGIEPYHFNLPDFSDGGPITASSVMDRKLFRAGDTVHMKHFVRKQTMRGISLADKNACPKAVSIRHTGSLERYEFPLKWDAKGIAETQWEIPKGAKLGTYDIHLLKEPSGKSKDAKRPETPGTQETDDAREEDHGYMVGALSSGSFRVEEFRVPLMKGLIQPPAAALVNVSEADLDVMVSYLSGGGAAHDDVKLRSELRPRYVYFSDYEGFTFANGRVSEGITKGVYAEEEDEASETPSERQRVRKKAFKTLELKLDQAGAARARLTNIERISTPHDIHAELEFKDPNGETQTVSQNIPLWPAKIIVGIKPDSWAISRDALKFHAVALGLDGKPVPQALIKVDLFQKKHYSHRKRLVGGFYSYSNWTETKRIGALCEGRTDSKGILICQVKSPLSGQVVLQAETLDDAGNVSTANQDVWIADKSDWWFRLTDNDRIDLLPEKKRYEPGETAKFQVRMPFREATALVAIEREGVVETFVKRLSGKKPVIEIPVKKTYAPNIFISALCVRGRVTGVQPTATVDLGKPAFKLGIAEIKVGWQAHEIKVQVATEKKDYRIRQAVPVHIKVVQAAGGAPCKGAEVAVAAVDEGLLELMPNDSWKLLEAMMAERGYGIRTSTAQMQVVGKRHFGLKAIPHGGGGGKQITRELFDTLLFWKARVPLNDMGEADVQVPLNDALTSFRIVAVASCGADKFGTGQTSIRSSQDLMLMSGLPPMIRESDRFRAGFTVRNASNRSMQVEVKAKLAGVKNPLTPIDVDLAPGAAQEIAWEAEAPVGKERLEWEVSAAAKDGSAEDRLKAVQHIAPAVPVRTFQATIMQLDKPVALDVERPHDALPQKGGIRVYARPKLVGGLSGVSYYMKNYPYTCMEQKVSRAIALQDGDLWKKVVAELPAHLDQDGLVKYFPRMPHGYDCLTAYILAIAHEAGWKIPDDIRKRMEAGLTGFIEGRVIRRSSMPTADLSIRKMAALEALSRSGRAEAKLLSAINVEANLWPTSAVLDWMNVLTRMEAIPDRETKRKEAEQIIRSRLNFQGTTMLFSTEQTDNLWWLMLNGDVNAVRTILTFLADDKWKDDMPRLVRGALGRMHRGAWWTTTANAWGVVSLKKFSDKFESQPVTGATTVDLHHDQRAISAEQMSKKGAVDFPWPDGKKPLSIRHEGAGKPWVTVQSLAAIPLKQPFSSGYKIKKTLTAVLQKAPGKWSRGDVVRVKLDMNAQADMTWVVVNDPIPAGSSILGTGLGRDSSILTQNEKATGWTWPAFEERSFEAFRAYYEYVPKGNWSIEYTVRLNNPGTFHLPETRVEALYAPEMFGEIPNTAVAVEP
ncbi:MAG: alpha-2-macroglobulin [Deltaproteobacteria bacterium]|nr:alpha-2-macroglobulin [Deltaproteobacteria bacterium]